MEINAEDNYPDGGLEAWLVVLGAWCAMIPSMGLLNTLAILQAQVFEHELPGFSESDIGWIFSCYAFFLYICGAQVGMYWNTKHQQSKADRSIGPIFDAYDIKVLIIPGCVGIVAAVMFFSVSHGTTRGNIGLSC